MAAIKLYLDEDITDDLAHVLRARGFDAVSTYEVERLGASDIDQLAFAVSEQRAILTFNVKHFVGHAQQYAREGKPHNGIIVSSQLEFGELLRRILNLLRLHTAEEMIDRLEWLQTYK